MASTNKTPQLGLNQWAAGDSVLRTDFNADNEKIEAAVGPLMAHKIAFGTYRGQGAFDIPISVNVGFKPAALIITLKHFFNKDFSCLAIEGQPVMDANLFLLRFTDTGFDVCQRRSNNTASCPNLADKNTYNYIAFC